MDNFTDWFEFKEWLKNKGDGAIVGIGGDSGSCPVARFLQETTGVRYVVSNFDYGERLANWGDWEALPDWAVEFVDLIDNSKRHDITKEMALELLDKATGEDIYDR